MLRSPASDLNQPSRAWAISRHVSLSEFCFEALGCGGLVSPPPATTGLSPTLVSGSSSELCSPRSSWAKALASPLETPSRLALFGAELRTPLTPLSPPAAAQIKSALLFLTRAWYKFFFHHRRLGCFHLQPVRIPAARSIPVQVLCGHFVSICPGWGRGDRRSGVAGSHDSTSAVTGSPGSRRAAPAPAPACLPGGWGATPSAVAPAGSSPGSRTQSTSERSPAPLRGPV